MSASTSLEATYDRAAEAIRHAEALVITAGAGMGVDSGLPDFRGNEGFWRAYPPYAELGLSFEDLASPDGFYSEPDLAWGFYGHRLELYRKTIPHEGFAILRRWAATKSLGHWVYTSNVDGQFQRASFDPTRVTECHGAIDFMQCNADCGADLFSADPFRVDVDPATFRARGALPRCPKCRGLARPNIAMFGDLGWNPSRTGAQTRRMSDWLKSLPGRRLVVIECGAGMAIPTVRRTSERLAEIGTLVRINVRDPAVPAGGLSLPVGALEGLRAIDRRLAAGSATVG
jgi:NAD-dependent SIR2 family protein deacetylase